MDFGTQNPTIWELGPSGLNPMKPLPTLSLRAAVRVGTGLLELLRRRGLLLGAKKPSASGQGLGI